MRGVAALFVMIRHFGELRSADYSRQMSYLAVDLFFVLSGFVLSARYADELRDRKIMPVRFLIARVIRLWPLYLAGLIVPVTAGLVEAAAARSGRWTLVTNVLTGSLMLPAPPGAHADDLFPMNVPSWSLFLEFYVANILFAVLPGATRSRQLAMLIVLGLLGLLTADVWFGSLDVGSAWRNGLGGLGRVIYSFFAGVALQKVHERRRSGRAVPAWILLLLLVVMLSWTNAGVAGRVAEIAFVVAGFPLLVYLDADATERFPALGRELGNTSYAIYVLHYGLMILTGQVLARAHIYPGRLVELLFITFLTVLGWLANKADLRVRRILTGYFSGRSSKRVTEG